MGKDSGIQWTTHTFNPWRGCTRVSQGCTHCYAEMLSRRNPKVLGVWGPQGTRVVASETKWNEVHGWDRAAMKAGRRDRVFCASLADVFEDWDGPMVDVKGNPLVANTWWPSLGRGTGDRLIMNHVRERLDNVIRKTANLNWLILTKRPENIYRMGEDHMFGLTQDNRKLAIPGNVWLGTTVEDQKAKARIDILRDIPSRVIKFLSIEPQIEDLGDLNLKGIDWVIVGGESGGEARLFDLGWGRSIMAQCEAQGVACFIKQFGSKPVESGSYLYLKDHHGGDMDEWPEDLRVRQFPNVPTAPVRPR
jgi:protein gp37